MSIYKNWLRNYRNKCTLQYTDTNDVENTHMGWEDRSYFIN